MVRPKIEEIVDAAGPAKLGAPPVERLARFERFNVRFMDTLWRRGRALTEAYHHWFTETWIQLAIGRSIDVRGLENITSLAPGSSVLLVANHRSYFDLYILALILYRRTKLRMPIVCPVRADFFYERPLGMFINLFVGAGRMYPPVFRQPAKQDFNKWAVARIVEILREGNVFVGFHPEGTRNKTDDPYTLLPAQPGVGKVVMDAWPTVIPAFVNGLSNSFVGDIKSNWIGDKKIYVVFGKPVDLSRFHGMSNRLATHKKIADALLDEVRALGEIERGLRARGE